MLNVAPSLPTHDSASIGVMFEYLSRQQFVTF
jgi:hypothetical protein